MSSPTTRILAPAQETGGSVPFVQALPYNAAGDVFVEGSIMSLDATTPGLFEGYASTPLINTNTGVVRGVALQGKDTNPGFEMGQDSDVVATTGRSVVASSVIPNRNTLFSVAITNAGTMDTKAELQVLVGIAFELALANGVWTLDANTDGTDPTTGSFFVERIAENVGPNGELWAIGSFVAAVLSPPA